ncbi:hypothetical protein [Leptolyngbya sp. CCY15150]|uniref:hypothetical protein n=1 Tax=Leptolyngbya sp. CCY15150 TaxID=2767772 RepID=UPI0019519B4B|nr:hypothetical protein [Leptolyngbya sp. CCY15150]
MADLQKTRKVLQAFLKFLDEISEEEYEQFLSGELKLGFLSEAQQKEKVFKGALEEDLQAIIEQLQEITSREEAHKLLKSDSRIRLKDDVIRIAKLLQVHVEKKDNREKIEARIVEFIVGVKLRNQAIQSLNLSSSVGNPEQYNNSSAAD